MIAVIRKKLDIVQIVSLEIVENMVRVIGNIISICAYIIIATTEKKIWNV